jgi:WD40 repeat protein
MDLLFKDIHSRSNGNTDPRSLNGNDEVTSEFLSSLQLATLTTHTKAVNIVRWSKDGKYLASAGDDNYICIHSLSSTSSSFHSGSLMGGTKNIENWIRSFTLIGHTLDILSLDWSVSGLLASGSVDNRILLWNIHSNIETTSKMVSPYQILSGHQSFVKGISFDPIGKYLISCDSSNQVIVWTSEGQDNNNILFSSFSSSTNSSSQPIFSLSRVLSEPLKGGTENSLFKRMHWSIDGTSLCLSSAMKSGKPIGMVLSRNDWTNIADLVGHKTNTLSTRFCPHLIQTTTSASSSSSIANIVALGDQDGMLSLWSTHTQRALFVFSELFSEAITDISWYQPPPPFPSSHSNTGNNSTAQLFLSCCSLSGEILFVSFDEEMEIGKPLTDETLLNDYYLSLYGKTRQEIFGTSCSSFVTNVVERMDSLSLRMTEKEQLSNNNRRNDLLVTNPLVLQYLSSNDKNKSSKQNNNKNNQNDTKNEENIPSQSSSSSLVPVVQTVDQRKKEKKRIQPNTSDNNVNPSIGTTTTSTTILTPSINSSAQIPVSVSSSSSSSVPLTVNPSLVSRMNGTISSSNSSTISVAPPTTSNHLPQQQSSSSINNIPFNPQSVSHTSSSSIVLQKQRVVINQQGKKRIRPMIESEEQQENDENEEVNSIFLREGEEGTLESLSSKKRLRFNDSDLVSANINSNRIISSRSNGSTATNVAVPSNNSVATVAVNSLTIHCHANNNLQDEISFHSFVHSFNQQLVSQSTGSSSKPISVSIETNKRGKHVSSSSSVGVLSLEAMNKPDLLRQISRHQVNQMIKLSLLRLGDDRHGNNNSLMDGLPREEKVIWSSLLSGNINCVKAVEWSSSPRNDSFLSVISSNAMTATRTTEGIVFVGSQDGSISLIDLSTGMTVVSSMILGSAIVFLDALLLLEENDDDEENGDEEAQQKASEKIRFLAMTSNGKIFVYDLFRNQPDKNSNLKRKSNNMKKRKMIEMVCQADVQSIVLSLRAASQQEEHHSSHSSRGTSSSSSHHQQSQRSTAQKELEIIIESCSLNPNNGHPILRVKSRSSSSSSSFSPSRSSSSAESILSDCSIYQFHFDYSNWQRIYHSKYFLSK